MLAPLWNIVAGYVDLHAHDMMLPPRVNVCDLSPVIRLLGRPSVCPCAWCDHQCIRLVEAESVDVLRLFRQGSMCMSVVMRCVRITIARDNAELLEWLMDYTPRAAWTCPDSEWFTLTIRHVAECGAIRVARWMVRTFASRQNVRDATGAFMTAARHRHIELAMFLAQNLDVDVDRLRRAGWVPLRTPADLKHSRRELQWFIDHFKMTAHDVRLLKRPVAA